MNTERDVNDLRGRDAHASPRPARRASRAASSRAAGLRVGLLTTVACAALVSVGSTSAYAQVAERSGPAVVHAEASGPAIGFRSLAVTLDVKLDALALRPVKGARAATLLAVRPDTSLQPPASTQQGRRGRSKKRIVAGAIVGSVGGFFAGGFLGAHIEGDRCDCDDPGVRGFLIGAPIGALAGGLFGAKFLF